MWLVFAGRLLFHKWFRNRPYVRIQLVSRYNNCNHFYLLHSPQCLKLADGFVALSKHSLVDKLESRNGFFLLQKGS